ncbi:MAG: TRAP transporter small permease [Alkalibacterium sp.]|nr:TRAP transporter small permease [Alkalibacterium sp.]
MMDKIRRVLDKMMRAFNVIVFSVLTLLTIWQVLTRYLLSNPSTWSEELASYLFAWVTLLGAAYVFGKREHMNIPILLDKASAKVQRVLSIFNELIILLFALVVLVYGGITITLLTMSQMSSSLPVAMGYFYVAIPISGLFTAIYCVLNIHDIVKNRIDLESSDSQLSTEDSHS